MTYSVYLKLGYFLVDEGRLLDKLSWSLEHFVMLIRSLKRRKFKDARQLFAVDEPVGYTYIQKPEDYEMNSSEREKLRD